MARSWCLVAVILLGACDGAATPVVPIDTGPDEATGTPAPLPTADTGDATVDPCDACLPEQVCDGGTCVDPALLVYLNVTAEGLFSYDPSAPDASTNEQASDPSLVGILAGYGAGPRLDTLVDLVRDDFGGFAPRAALPQPNGIHLVVERPRTRGDYHMVVLTPNAPVAGQIGLGSPANCGNVSKEGIFFAFFSANDTQPTQFQANIVSAAIGNLVGLGSVNDGSDTMSASFAFDVDLEPRDVCLTLQGLDFCPEFNADFCPEGQQNTAAALRFHARQGGLGDP